jgi:hypothetical protein
MPVSTHAASCRTKLIVQNAEIRRYRLTIGLVDDYPLLTAKGLPNRWPDLIVRPNSTGRVQRNTRLSPLGKTRGTYTAPLALGKHRGLFSFPIQRNARIEVRCAHAWNEACQNSDHS